VCDAHLQMRFMQCRLQSVLHVMYRSPRHTYKCVVLLELVLALHIPLRGIAPLCGVVGQFLSPPRPERATGSM